MRELLEALGLHADRFAPPWGWGWTTAAIVVLGLALAWGLVTALARRPAAAAVLALLRAGALVVVVWLLAGPMLDETPQRAPTPPRVVLLADTSASMARADCGDGGEEVSRLTALRRTWLAPPFIDALRRGADVRVLAFDERTRPLPATSGDDAAANGAETRLFEALEQAATQDDGDSGGGDVLVLSDGHDTQRGVDLQAVARLAQLRWRVHAVPVGRPDTSPDVALTAWADADYVMQGQPVTIHASVTQRGFTGQAAAVDLLEEGRLIQSRPIAFHGDAPVQVAFEVRPESDAATPTMVRGYEVVVRPEPGGPEESHADNNDRWVFVQVTRERMRVLLLEGQPYWDTRFLARTLAADPQVDLTSVFQTSGQRTLVRRSVAGVERDAGEAGTVVPRSAVELAPFDVVILGRGIEAFFPGEQAVALVDYVQGRGGALVLARGRPFVDDARAAELTAGLAPVEWGRGVTDELALRVTAEGRRSPLVAGPSPAVGAVITHLPGLVAATRVERARAAAVVLLEQRTSGGGGAATPMAALAYQSAGAGRVLAVLGDGLYRWAFLPTKLAEYDSAYALFWARALRWLAAGGEFLPGQSVSLQLDRLATQPGEPVSVTVTTRYATDEPLEATLTATGPGGDVQTLQLTQPLAQEPRYTATVTPRGRGVYRVELVASGEPGQPTITASARLAVYESSVETADTSARPEVLRAVAQTGGGRVWSVDEPEALLRYVEDAAAARRVEPRSDYAFSRPIAAVLIVGLLMLEWIGRRRAGMM